jgi:Nitrogen regulatory protein P-II
MKMILVICPEKRTEELSRFIERHDIDYYSELHEVTGKGTKGPKFGNRIWPGTSILFAMVVPNEKKNVLMEALREYRDTLLSEESMHAFVVPVEEAF